jgi:UDP-N-acetyl-D-glucosamine dehydrogenase
MSTEQLTAAHAGASTSREQVVVVLGQGYVGLPLAMRAVDAGYRVVGFDVDAGRVTRLRAGISDVEDIADKLVDAALAAGAYLPTSDPADCAGFDIAVIAVPTPLREGNPDLGHVTDATRVVAAHLRPGATVVLESTTYPGTTEELVGPLLVELSGLRPGADFALGYSPERIDPGNPTWGLANTPKVVSGVDAASLRRVEEFYGRLVDRTVPVKGTREAEMTKLLENTFRHVNIALVNELAMFAEELGIDIWEAIDAASTKPFGYMRFTPGPGVGGHCLPVDPTYLSWRVRRELGYPFRFVELANDVNDHMPDYVVRRLTASLNRRGRAVNGTRVLVVGLAYKKNTGDARETPTAEICRRLIGLGAEVVAADPHVAPERFPVPVTRVALTLEEVRAADVALVLVDHDEFDLSLLEHCEGLVFDTRNVVRGRHVETL